ncbi:MAG: hypothetical protein NUV56_03485 [Candidatus Uhrbacteria bacterium]|nr:hypothetical protein [Candidatus Uhrbacteria bacterium]
MSVQLLGIIATDGAKRWEVGEMKSFDIGRGAIVNVRRFIAVVTAWVAILMIMYLGVMLPGHAFEEWYRAQRSTTYVWFFICMFSGLVNTVLVSIGLLKTIQFTTHCVAKYFGIRAPSTLESNSNP